MISFIIPYRDRQAHLDILTKQLTQCPQLHEVIVVEQAPGKPFNRGKLLNVGALNAKGTFFIFHDVDMIPQFKQYRIDHHVIQYAKSNIQRVGYLGGVTGFMNATFFYVGGYSNNFFSRAEDNEMRFNLYRKHEPVFENFMKFKTLDHDRPKLEFDLALWQKAQLPRTPDDGVFGTKWKTVEEITAPEAGFHWLKVEI